MQRRGAESHAHAGITAPFTMMAVLAAKLLRIYLLMYGKRPRIREIVRALRAG